MSKRKHSSSNNKHIIIARLSTKPNHSNQYKSDDIQSIQHQIDVCNEKIDSIGECEDKDVHTFIGSAFNKSNYTKSITQLIRDTKNNVFYFSRVDRFSRNILMGMKWLNLILNNNHQIYFVEQNLDYSIMNKQRVHIELTNAQNESETISQRVLCSNQRKKQNYIWKNTKVFGGSFERKYEIMLCTLINKLMHLEDNNETISTKDLSTHLKLILREYPMEKSIIDERIRYIHSNPIMITEKNEMTGVEKKIEILSDNQTPDEISDLLNAYGIFFLYKENDVLKEGCFLSFNKNIECKTSYYAPSKYRVILQGNNFAFKYKLKNGRTSTEITIECIAQHLVDNKEEDVSELVDDLIRLNQENIPNLTKKSFLKNKTELSVPIQYDIPENNKVECYMISTHRIIENFMYDYVNNMKKEDFKKKVYEMNDLNIQSFENLSMHENTTILDEPIMELPDPITPAHTTIEHYIYVYKQLKDVYGKVHEKTKKALDNLTNIL